MVEETKEEEENLDGTLKEHQSTIS